MSSKRRAFTLVELLVVIAIIGVLVGLLIPSLQSMRESARRTNCQTNLVAIGLAMQTYHDRWMQFPVGTVAEAGPIRNVAAGNHHNWLGRLMEPLDQAVIESHLNRSVSIYSEQNEEVLSLGYPGSKCPSDSTPAANASSYVGLHHPTEKPIDDSDWGVFVLNTPISRDDVSDGLSNTLFLSEKISTMSDLGWLSGTRATLRNTGDGIQSDTDQVEIDELAVGSIGSRHPAGANAMFGTGEFKFLSSSIDIAVLQQMTDRRDGQLPLHFLSIEQLRQRSIQ
ncbi:DUF1559 domain-containing protein [Rhodopirellula sp. MGV]|uniref:DUF1559 family PulG-like putative transporter n=1 Tax=Rhodopirellula sp. MGV TaxID=2023130 RepID=UPI000B972BF5|nr:DUF1559 domain-containing protein [Rhodopirellula sp. MGV]OYP34914.1 prepilin-type cleavage/methylation domain-containing protein [Rhodopirellula sp. MGV]PNY38189.1 DUF1559 domain-containing protein [Rhodopirellula baltica]